MIGKLLNGIFKLVIGLVTTLLAPIDTLIENSIPALSDGLNAVNSVIDFAINSLGYVIDLSGLTDIAIFLIVGYWTFSITSTLAISVVKLAIKWYQALVP